LLFIGYRPRAPARQGKVAVRYREKGVQINQPPGSHRHDALDHGRGLDLVVPFPGLQRIITGDLVEFERAGHQNVGRLDIPFAVFLGPHHLGDILERTGQQAGELDRPVRPGNRALAAAFE
jgi:hypothetical protein